MFNPQLAPKSNYNFVRIGQQLARPKASVGYPGVGRGVVPGVWWRTSPSHETLEQIKVRVYSAGQSDSRLGRGKMWAISLWLASEQPVNFQFFIARLVSLMSYRKIKIKQNFYSLSNSYLGSVKSAVLISNITVLREGYFYFPIVGRGKSHDIQYSVG